MATLTSADFAGLIAPPTLIEITTSDNSATGPDETVIGQAGVKTDGIMRSVLGFDPTDVTRLPAATYTEVRLDVARLVLYQRRPELLFVENGKHPVQKAADDALARLARFATADAKTTVAMELIAEAPVGLGRGV